MKLLRNVPRGTKKALPKIKWQRPLKRSLRIAIY